MVDRWGRPTFDDGMNIARSVMAIQGNMERKKDRKIEEDAFKGFNLLKKDPAADLSGLDDKARYMAHKMLLDDRVSQTTAELKEMRKTTEGMKQAVQQMKLLDAEDQRDKKIALSALSSGDEATFKKYARQIFNRAPNGLHVKEAEGGKLVKTGLAGKAEEMDDLPVDQYKEMLGAYFEMDPQEKLQARIASKQIIQQHNQEIISNGEPMMNDKGETIYRIPSGTRDIATGEIKDAFYLRSLDDQVPLTEKEIKGFKRMPKEVKKLYDTLGRKPTGKEREVAAGVRSKIEDEKQPSPSTMEKEINALGKIYGISEKEAADMYRRDKAFKQMYDAYMKDLEAYQEIEFDPEKIEQKRVELRKKHHIDEYIQSYFNQGVADKSEFPDEMMIAHRPGGGQQAGQAASKQLDKATALEYLKKTNGDRAKAEELARKEGYVF